MRFLLLSLCLLGYTPVFADERLTIAAASDLRYALNDMVTEYRPHRTDGAARRSRHRYYCTVAGAVSEAGHYLIPETGHLRDFQQTGTAHAILDQYGFTLE